MSGGKNHSQVIGEEKISKLLWKFSAPATVGMIVNSLYYIVDSIFVGNWVGTVGLAGISIAFPIMNIMTGFSVLVSIGAASLVSIRLGEHRQEEAERILGNSLTLLLLITFVMTVVGLFFLDDILVVLGADSSVLSYAKDYSQIIMLGSVFMYVGFGLNPLLRAAGHPQTAMVTMLISAGTNIVLNPLFIIGLGMGIKGSAWATIIAQSISAVWVIFHFVRKKTTFRLRWAKMLPDKRLIFNIIKIGMSSFLLQSGTGVITSLFNYILILYGGNIALAANGIINRVAMFSLMPVFGINMGSQPIIGYNYGAKQYDRVKETLRKVSYTVLAVCSAFFLLIEFFAPDIIQLFDADVELVEVGVQGLKIGLFMLPLIGLQVVGTNYFQAVGKAGMSIFLSMLRHLFLIPMLLILPNVYGLTGIWLANPISDFGAAIIIGIYLFWEMRKFDDINKESSKLQEKSEMM
jgi:putative MATE family efflux protein